MFSIDSDKNLTFSETSVSGALNFSTEKALLALADAQKWTREDLEEIWNSFAGAPPFQELKPTKKFRNRPFAVKRIWDVIQRLADVPAKEPEPTPVEAKAEEKPKRAAKKAAASTEPKKRDGSKRDKVIALITRKTGASVQEIMDAMGWQRHSVRGFVSTLGSKHNFPTVSEKDEKRGLVYRVPPAA